jgi:hypothetical protein
MTITQQIPCIVLANKEILSVFKVNCTELLFGHGPINKTCLYRLGNEFILKHLPVLLSLKYFLLIISKNIHK